jgi:hypothetical protein
MNESMNASTILSPHGDLESNIAFLRYGLEIEVPGATILSTFGFKLAFWRDVIGLGIFAGSFIILAYGAMHLLLVEKR